MASSEIKNEWREDTLYGRYEVTLAVDVGTIDSLLFIYGAVKEFAAGLDVLGWEARAITHVGGEKKRNAKARRL